jgi:predicted  nucleic acid-binding Zn-ribbon protein
MFEGAMRSLFSILNVDPEEVKAMVFNVSEGVTKMEASITRIENGITDIQKRMTVIEEVLEITAEEIEGNGHDKEIQTGRNSRTYSSGS